MTKSLEKSIPNNGKITIDTHSFNSVSETAIRQRGTAQMLPLSILPRDMDNMSTDERPLRRPCRGSGAKGACPPLEEIRESLLKELQLRGPR